MTVYRGQFLSLIELEDLKAAKGGLIAMTSFLSTTRDHTVATMFAGNGEKPANFEPVIFEIYIEQSNLEEERRPFANIREVSSKKDEDEILLCMGTVMRIDLVEPGKEMTRICLRTCPYDDSAWQYSKVDLLSCESSNSVDETDSLRNVVLLLYYMGEWEKAEQFIRVIKSSTDPEMHTMCQFNLMMVRMMRQMNVSDQDFLSNFLSNIRMGMYEMEKHSQSIINDESVPDCRREIHKRRVQYIATFLDDDKNSKDLHSMFMLTAVENEIKTFENMQRYGTALPTSSMYESLIKPLHWFPESAESNAEQMKSIMYDRVKSNMDKILPEKDSYRHFMLFIMATYAKKDGDYDRAIALVREGLSVTCSYGIGVLLYEFLAEIYKEQKNWPAAIESYQSIIDMPEIPPSSSAIVKAHIERGDACIELDDLSEALISYTNALELQSQHHVPNHPLTSKIHIKIGNVFKKTENVSAALESYNEAITFGFPDTASEVYEAIGIIYMRQGNYDMARSNFIKCLEIRKDWTPHKTFLLALTHIWLAIVEHKTEHYQQRDFHFQQARKLAIHDEEDRDFITERISQILGEVTPTTS